jgi:hypothetical protein
MRRKTVRSLLILLVVGALGFLVACGSSGTPVGVTPPPPPGQNIQPISVNGGPLGNYANGAFVSVEICLPGTTTCQTINDVLVDTGSVGLRLLASQVTINPPVLNDGNGDNLNNCIQFLDGSFLWGDVAQADIKMAGEVASSTSVQLIANPTGGYLIPPGCTGINETTQQTLDANGILGVGPEPFDCGPGCDPVANAGGTPPPVYYLCSANTGCVATFVPCGNVCQDTQAANAQITNPVFNFTGDNNGVILQLPSLASAAATVSGSLIFGIGTQSNNTLGSAAVLLLNSSDEFTTSFSGQLLTSSFIDSGSNGLFFPNGIETGFAGDTIPVCTDNTSFYCPATLTPFSATNESGSTNSAVNFSVDNSDNLSTQNPGDFAFVNLGGPLGSGACNATSNPTACSFDFGLPFFYGRSVFTAIDGAVAPTGVPAGPFVAY